MDLFEVLGLLGVLALWAALGCVPWFIGLVATRAQRAPWRSLPVVVAAAAGAGALTPALGLKDAFGFGLSLLVALTAGVLVTIASTRYATD